MSIWLIETFGSAKLGQLFYFLLGMTAPVWLLMIFMPQSKWVRSLAHPYWVSALFACLQFYLFYLAATKGASLTGTIDYATAKSFFHHPLVFLALLCQIQISNLFIGMVLYREAAKSGILIPCELVLCWLAGPLGIIAYLIHMRLLRA